MNRWIKARYEALKHDPYRRGLLVGSVVGIGSAVAAGYALRINYDYDGLYIPDSVINNIRRTGAPALTTKNDAHIAISLISISEV